MARLKRSPKWPTLRPSANNWTCTTDSPRDPSPGLTANLPSNNPFRNRTASPLPSPVTTTFNNIPSTAPEKPLSRNPFLDQSQSDKKDATTAQVRQTSPERGPYTMAARSSPRKPPLTGHAIELFVGRPLLIPIMFKPVDPNSASFRTILRLTMGLRPPARHRKACLHRTPITPHDQRTTLHSLLTVCRDIIHHDHKRMGSIGRIR